MSTSPASTDKRVHVRKELAAGQLLFVDLIPLAPSRESERHAAIILNHSQGGVALQPLRAALPDDVSEFRLVFPQALDSPQAVGRIAWKGKGGCLGFRFVDDPSARNNEFRYWLYRNFESNGNASSLLSALSDNSGAGEFETALHLIAYSAMETTGASGAAIALGDSAGAVCRASVGSAPEPGAYLDPDEGLSGSCLRTGQSVSSLDVRSDPLVDSAVAQRMKLRSLLVVPILLNAKVQGVLEVFAVRPQAFSKEHMERLHYYASVVAHALQEEYGSRDEHSAELANSIASLAKPLQFAQHESGDFPSAPSDPSLDAMTPAQFKTPDASAVIDGFRSEIENEQRRRLPGFIRQPRFVAALVITALLFFAAWLQLRSSAAQPGSVANTSSVNVASAPVNVESTIRLDPPNIAQSVGAKFNSKVVIQGAKNATLVRLRVLYDPEKLRLMEVSAGDVLNGPTIQSDDAPAGSVQIVATSSRGISGDGTLVTLGFLAKNSGHCQLRINPPQLRDSNSRLTRANGTEAEVEISPSK